MALEHLIQRLPRPDRQPDESLSNFRKKYYARLGPFRKKLESTKYD